MAPRHLQRASPQHPSPSSGEKTRARCAPQLFPAARPRHRRRRPAISAAPSRRAAVFVFHCFTAVLIPHPSRPLLTLGASSGPRGAGALSRPGFICIFISPISSSWPRCPSPETLGGSAPARRARANEWLSILYRFLYIFILNDTLDLKKEIDCRDKKYINKKII